MIKKQIIKASGQEVIFDPSKLRLSLRRSGASSEEADAVVQAILDDWRTGLTTKQVYRRAHRLLRRYNKTAASRYSLKQALFALGPTGYPFETFVARLLEADGFTVQKGILQQGHCINHEVDILAEKNKKIIFGECKFRNSQQLINDVKVVLYIRSRFEDLRQGEWREWLNQGRSLECFVFTNTRFTEDALRYGECSSMTLVSWDTPNSWSLREWVNRTGLHPITCLSSLTRREKTALVEEHHIVLVQDLVKRLEVLDALGVSDYRRHHAIKEAEALCELAINPMR